jgi:hypothetical protein
MAVNPDPIPLQGASNGDALQRVRLQRARDKAKTLGLRVKKEPGQTRYWLLPTEEAVVDFDLDSPMTVAKLDLVLRHLGRQHFRYPGNSRRWNNG